MSLLALTSSILLHGSILLAHAWGPAVHQDIEAAAVQILVEQGHPLGALLKLNLETLKEVALIPDSEWKAESAHEIESHYFEVDAFVGSPDMSGILSLPKGEYVSAYNQYQDLLRDNASYVVEFGKRYSDSSAYGTSPWRVIQFYDLSVNALKEKKLTHFLYFLGLLGHYVADISEPLNSTLNFDGMHYPVPAVGVYQAFEESLYSPDIFNKALAESKAALAHRGVEGLTRDRILPELFKIIADGYPFVDSLLSAFSDQCGRTHLAGGRALASVELRETKTKNGKKIPTAPVSAPKLCDPSISRAAIPEFLKNFGGTPTLNNLLVRDLIPRRMGEAAAELARLWASIFNESDRPSLSLEVLKTNQVADDAYIAPNYLPSQKYRRGPGSAR